jgi:hypothetical protein
MVLMSDSTVLQRRNGCGNYLTLRRGSHMSLVDADTALTGTDGERQHRDVIFLAEGLCSFGDLLGSH